MYQLQSVVVDMMKAMPVVFISGAILIPISVSAIGFGGGGPVGPNQPPQLTNPFGSQKSETSQSAEQFTYLCVCDQSYCGNNAISGRYGQTRKDIPADDLPRKYGPERTEGEATGWRCLQQGTYRCECAASACGNDAKEAVQGAIFEDVPTERVVNEFRHWRTGDRVTGWDCALSPATGE